MSYITYLLWKGGGGHTESSCTKSPDQVFLHTSLVVWNLVGGKEVDLCCIGNSLAAVSSEPGHAHQIGWFKQKIGNESIFTCCWTWCYCCEVSWWCGDSSCCMSGSGRSWSWSWMNCRRCRLCWHGSGGWYNNSCFGHCMCGCHRNMTTWLNGWGSSIHIDSAIGAVAFGS